MRDFGNFYRSIERFNSIQNHFIASFTIDLRSSEKKIVRLECYFIKAFFKAANDLLANILQLFLSTFLLVLFAMQRLY